MNDKINQLVLVHLFGMKVRYQETDIVSVHGFSSENDKVFGSHHHESGEFVTEDFLNFVRLFDRDANSHGIDARLDQYAFFLVARNDHGCQNELFTTFHFDLGLVMPLDYLRREILKAHCSSERMTDGRQVGF